MSGYEITGGIAVIIGIIFVAVSFVHRRLGMWNLSSDWSGSRRGLESPKEETLIGVDLIFLGIDAMIWGWFGLKFAALALVVESIGSVIFGAVMFSRCEEDDKDYRSFYTVIFILGICAAALGGLMYALMGSY